MSLLSSNQLRALQRVGELGMTATVEIRPATTDIGLDSGDDPYGSIETTSLVPITVKGWLVGTWALSRGRGAGDIDTTTAYHLRLPVGTPVEPGDTVSISGRAYLVIDVGDDQTWPEWLTCIVRRSK